MCYAFGTLTQRFDQAVSVTVTIAASPPALFVDTPSRNVVIKPPFRIAGWAADWGAAGPGVDTVHVWAYPASSAPFFLGAAAYGSARPDVAALLGAAYANSGFSLQVGSLAPGAYDLVAYAHSSVTGTFNNAKVVPITVAPSDTRIFIDVPAPAASLTSGFAMVGWAIDLGAGAGTGVDAVHVWAHPVGGGAPTFVGAAVFGARPDVAAAFGAQYLNAGFLVSPVVLPAGTYDLTAYVHSTVTGTFANARSVRIVVK